MASETVWRASRHVWNNILNTQGPRYLSVTGASLSISREETLFLAYLTRTIVRVIVLSAATRRYT